MDYQKYDAEQQRAHLTAQLQSYEAQHFQHSLIAQEHEAAAAGEDTDEEGQRRATDFRTAATASRRSATEAANRAAVYAAALKTLDGVSKPEGPRTAE